MQLKCVELQYLAVWDGPVQGADTNLGRVWWGRLSFWTNAGELNCTLKNPWGAHVQGSRGMQAEPLPLLTAVSLCLMSCVMCMIWYDPALGKGELNKADTVLPYRWNTPLYVCVIFLQSSFSFFTPFLSFRCFYLSNRNLFQENVSSSCFRKFSLASQNKCQWVP